MSEGLRGMRGRRPRLLVLSAVALVLVVLALAVVGCSQSGTSTTSRSGGKSTTVATGGGGTGTTGSVGNGSTTGSTIQQPGDITISPAEAIAKDVGPSVVNVNASGTVVDPYFGSQQYQGVGSGIIFSADGMIVTNNHVVAESGTAAQKLTVTLKTGEVLTAKIVGRDSFTDVAVIKVDRSGLPPANFLTDRSNVRVGEYAVAIGSPLDYANSVSLGIVSGLQRNIANAGSGSQSLIDLIQTDAAISPGNSGGALVDAQGRVIGMNVAYLPPSTTGAQNIGFAIPGDTVVSIAQQIIKTGQASHPYLGIQYQSVTPDLQQQYNLSTSSGILVTSVGTGTPAQQAGLQQGDIITAVNGQKAQDESTLLTELRQKKAGDKLSLTINRNGKTQNLQVTLAERPTGQ